MKAKFKNLLFRWMIFNRGIRFYETTVVPKSPDFESVRFELIDGHEIYFYFYKEECEDLIHRRGKISKERFTGYTIQAQFDEVTSQSLQVQQFNNLKFFFNGKDFPPVEERVIVEYLLEVYVDFIRNELKK